MTTPNSASSPRNRGEKYRELAELGRGGSAIVTLAVARGPGGFNKLVVLKRVREEFRDEGDAIRLFFDEARLAARMSHPNVVQTNEVIERAGLPVIVMEYLQGQTLQAILVAPKRRDNVRSLELRLHLQVIYQALAGLGYAHTLRSFDGKPMNLVHRDVTPHNLFITYDGHVKLLDFGIAKLSSSSVQTTAGVVKGKLVYMAKKASDVTPYIGARYDSPP
jgi:serine/threonine-protein kinase